MLYVIKLIWLIIAQDYLLLNQARAGQRPACNWFLEIAFVHDVSMRVCVCVRPRGY